ncbi:MAG: class I SAM-dependent methyltransferase [Candidatus Acidiferrales bacterium]
MRRDWDDRARKDAFFYIASWKEHWDEDLFFRSGEEDYLRLADAVFQRLNFEPAGKSMLELGCGAGRMTRSFAQRFERVVACDVSPEMLERARTLNAGLPGVTWFLANGEDLSEIASGSADFVFSYLVLQHLPAERLVHDYIAEMMRVLTAGGLCLFQFNSSNRYNMNWKGRLAWGFVDMLWTLRLHGASKSLASGLGLDPQMGGKSWHGASIPADRIYATVRHNSGVVLEKTGEHTPMAWCCAKKLAGGEEKITT